MSIESLPETICDCDGDFQYENGQCIKKTPERRCVEHITCPDGSRHCNGWDYGQGRIVSAIIQCPPPKPEKPITPLNTESNIGRTRNNEECRYECNCDGGCEVTHTKSWVTPG